MIDIILVEPEIPANTGNISRTCSVTGARLHLIEPLGFDISDKALKRAGLDYWQFLDVRVYKNLDEYFEINGDDNLWLAALVHTGNTSPKNPDTSWHSCSLAVLRQLIGEDWPFYANGRGADIDRPQP